MFPVTFQMLIRQPQNKIQQRKRTVTSVAMSCEESTFNNKSITKTISNYFFKPQKIPQAIEERNHYKTITAKPFFAKTRKLSEENNKLRRDNNPIMVPNSFKNILRAKSTVIKQTKLQEFYINRQGRADNQKLKASMNEIDDCKSNLFRPNFPQRRAKPTRKHSHQMEKYQKYLNLKDLKVDAIELPKQVSQSFHTITENLCEMVLMEKISAQNNEIAHFKKKKWFEHQSLPQKYHRRQNKHIYDKQNLQFQLQPWKAQECDDFAF